MVNVDKKEARAGGPTFNPCHTKQLSRRLSDSAERLSQAGLMGSCTGPQTVTTHAARQGLIKGARE